MCNQLPKRPAEKMILETLFLRCTKTIYRKFIKGKKKNAASKLRGPVLQKVILFAPDKNAATY